VSHLPTARPYRRINGIGRSPWPVDPSPQEGFDHASDVALLRRPANRRMLLEHEWILELQPAVSG
jgi:hypothetical protein